MPKSRISRLIPLGLAGSIASIMCAGMMAVPAPAPAVAAPAVAAPDDAGLALDELSYEHLMEQSLTQAVDSYLGDERFIIQVQVAMSRTGAPAAPPVAAAPQVPDDTFPLPGLPGLNSEPVTSANQVPEPVIPAAPPSAPAVPAGLSVDRQRVLVIVDRALTQDDQDFLKTLIDQKANLDYARGDDLRFEQRTFPGGPAEALVASGSPPVPSLPVGDSTRWWLEALAAFLGVGLLVALFALLRRRPAAVAALEPALPRGPGPALLAESQASPPASADDPVKKADREAAILRQELVVMLLEYPELGVAFVQDLLKKEAGARKAAIVLRALGLQGSSRMFTGLASAEWGKVEAEFPAAREASPAETHRAIEEAYQVLVAERAASLANGSGRKNSPFAFLDKLDDSQIVFILEAEGIKIKALALSQLPIKRAAALIRRWPPEEQGAIASAIGELEAVPITAFQSIADKLAAKAEQAPSFSAIVTDGVQLLVDILDNADDATERRILDTLRTSNPSMMRRVKEIYFTFEDIPRLPPALIKDAVREMDPVRLAMALRGTDQGLDDMILDALTERRRALVMDGIEELEGRPPESQAIGDARRELVGRIRTLIFQGRFSLKALAEG